jgi:peptide deformylase
MAILKIARMGHPILRGVAGEVPDPTVLEIAKLIDDMYETMVDAEGQGLAAPQVHVPLRLVIFRMPLPLPDDGDGGGDEDARRRRPLRVLINPVIEPVGGEMETGWEGCLSLPDLRGKVPRYSNIRYSALTPEGGTIEAEAEGMHARVVQHECDHLDGFLYPQRMEDLSTLMFESESKYSRAAAEDGDDGEEDEYDEDEDEAVGEDEAYDEEAELDRAS